MHRWRAAWRWARRWLVIVFAGILFYEILEHFDAARSALGEVLRVLRPLLAGLLIAYIVNIPSTLLQRIVFKKFEGKRFAIIISNLIAYLFVLGLIALLVLLIVPKAVEGVTMLFSNIGTYYNAIVNWATEFWEGLDLSDEITERAIEISRSFAERAENFAMEFLPKVINFTFSTVGKLTNVVLAIAFSVYALADKGKLLAHARRFIRAAFSEKNAERILEISAYANGAYRGYITGQLTSSTIIGILCYIGMLIFKMPYPEMISVFIAAFTLIPVLGPWISTIPSALIILMASPDNPMLAVWFVVMLLVIQQIDNNLIYPKVVGNAVGLSSAWVIIAIIVFGGLFGVPGLLFSVPTTAVIYRLVAEWTNARAKSRGVPIVDDVPRNFEKMGRGGNKKRRIFFSGRGKKKGAANVDGSSVNESEYGSAE
ncbi:MAG: AI-2E family transporter [Clostridia bacterium]|nr:AI-2E family transporter [Clostridia bacterium]